MFILGVGTDVVLTLVVCTDVELTLAGVRTEVVFTAALCKIGLLSDVVLILVT